MEQAKGDLSALLKSQIINYKKAIDLERKLLEHIEKSDFQSIAANTAEKMLLMGEIQSSYEKLLPFFAQEAGEVRLENPEAEKLRREAVTLLKELQELEAKNLAKINEIRSEMMANLQQTQTAKQAAKSYKSAKTKSSRYLDTKE